MTKKGNYVVEACLELFRSKKHSIDAFRTSVEHLFVDNPALVSRGRPIVHSTKSRTKDETHLAEKISRKIQEGRDITPDKFFSEVTDLAGVRVLLLYQDDFSHINKVIREKIELEEDWFLAEPPKAYTWDPENSAFFERHGVDSKLKDSSYTSVHYLVRPHEKSPIHCEIQVRTLFEEIWGEVDHHLNYPSKSENPALVEQIKVLSKIVGAGSRLLDSIHRVDKIDNDDIFE